MEGGFCEDCKYSFDVRGTNCGHHFRNDNDSLDMNLPSDGALDRFGRCSYYKRYRTNMDVMRKKLRTVDDEEPFLKIIMDFVNNPELKTDEDRINWLKEEYEEEYVGKTKETPEEIPKDITLPVIKCKDCVYLGRSVGGGVIDEFHLCAQRIAVVRENGFCIWGKEKEDGN